ncbi:hypothetical protein J5TS2_24340 [Brevibacillus halotolerans]|nr:hypothetical protein J5TS2_24340 [Brevibacillus halotolerans]
MNVTNTTQELSTRDGTGETNEHDKETIETKNRLDMSCPICIYLW